MADRRIGLVLGAGGLTGTAFHAGVIAGLARFAGWDARTCAVVVGTSAGSTSAALLRAGLPPADFVARMAGAPMSAEGRRVLGGLGPLQQPTRKERTPPRPAAPGLIPSMVRRPWRYRAGIAAAALLPEGKVVMDAGLSWVGSLFDGWPDRPTWICAVRLDDGVRVVFGRDAKASMREAVSASCAIPGYYAPVLIDGRRHVDGGMWSAHNLDLVAELGLDAVVVSAPMSTADSLAAERSTLVRLPVRRQLELEVARVRKSGTPVVVIHPDSRLRNVMGANPMSLERRAPIAAATQSHVRELVAAGRLDAIVSGGRRG